MTVNDKLYNFTKETAYPYILQQPFYVDHSDKISVLLVGSVATGLCSEHSDVDICLLCDESIFNDISTGTAWIKGRPTEIIINDIQLHYYAICYQDVMEKIASNDDVSFYVYGTAISLNDNSGLYVKLKKTILSEEIKKNRKDNAFDILIRRNRALKQILKNESDVILRIKMGLEIIEHVLRAIALTDGVQFDIRKRFYTTSLKGVIGQTLIEKIEILTHTLSDIGDVDDYNKSRMFMQLVDDCIELVQRN